MSDSQEITKPDFEAAVDHFRNGSIENLDILSQSTSIVCFHCLKRYTYAQIRKCVIGPGGEKLSALCPFCSVDAVVGDAYTDISSDELVKQAQFVAFYQDLSTEIQ